MFNFRVRSAAWADLWVDEEARWAGDVEATEGEWEDQEGSEKNEDSEVKAFSYKLIYLVKFYSIHFYVKTLMFGTCSRKKGLK